MNEGCKIKIAIIITMTGQEIFSLVREIIINDIISSNILQPANLLYSLKSKESLIYSY